MILDNPSLPRIDLEDLQRHLFKESISATSTADPGKADHQPNTINVERDRLTRCSQSVRFRVPHRKVRATCATAGVQVPLPTTSQHEDSVISFLPSTVPETMDEFAMEEIDETIGVVIESAEREVNGQTQQSNDATQAISQTAYDEVIRSRSEQAPSHTSQDVEEKEQDEIEEDVMDEDLQHSIQEGDSEFVDILSSYAAAPAPFSPTQTQLPPSQFPESQRFKAKTPATAGRKRDYSGNFIDSPTESRNPFARERRPLTGHVVGLSQAFENTQAASSPVAVVPTSALRSDKPSPGIEIQRRIEDSDISSPSRFLTDPRHSTGPAATYVPAGQSQILRTMTSGSEDNDHTQPSTNDDFDSLPSAIAKKKKAREIEAKARADLKAASSPIQSPQKSDALDPAYSPRRARSEGLARSKPTTTSRSKSRSLPSSPPLSDTEGKEDNEALTSVAYDILSDAPTLPVVTKSKPHQPSSATNSLRNGTLIEVPNTSRRTPPSSFRQSYHARLSPSELRAQHGRVPVAGDPFSSNPIRIANSQKSMRSSQEAIQNLTTTSTAESVDVIPASPEGQLQSTEPSTLLRTLTGEDRGGPVTDGHSRRNSLHADTTDLPVSKDSSHVVSGSNTSPDMTGQQHQKGSTYETAPTNHAAGESDWSSQPVRATPPGRKRRKRLGEISQDNDLPAVSQSSAFDPMEVLAPDQDPDVARVLVSSQDPHSLRSRKRTRLNTNTVMSSDDTDQAMEEAFNTPGRYSGLRSRNTRAVHDEVHTEKDTVSSPLTSLASTPSHVGTSLRNLQRQQKSLYDLEDSPKREKQVTTPVPNVATRPIRSSLQDISANHRRRVVSKTKLGKPRPTTTTLSSIEEASPDPLAIDVTSVVSDMSTSDSKKVVAPQMIFVRYAGAYHPAICQGYSAETEKYTILWPGYAPERMARNSLCSLDLKIGDEVKVSLPNWPKKAWKIREFGLIGSEESGTEMIRDIYGHSSIMLEPKNHKHAMPKGVTSNDPISLGKIYIDSNQWARVNKRPFVYQISATEERMFTHTPRFSSPQVRSSNASTPSPRGRKTVKDAFIQPATKEGIFSNMVFVLSFKDLDTIPKTTDLIRDNGGSIVQSSFRELLTDDLKIKSNLGNLTFAALIADRHSRKEKYMQALAFGLPCLSGRWVEVSVKRQQLVEWQDYLLPAGESKELAGAVRSRVLPPIDMVSGKLSAIFDARPQFFTDAKFVFLRGRNKAEIARKTFQFFVRVAGATKVEEVSDLTALSSHLKNMEQNSNVWVIVDEKETKDSKESKESEDFKGASKIVRGLKKETRENVRQRDNVDDGWVCKIADHEFIMQSLILGRLCEEDSEE